MWNVFIAMLETLLGFIGHIRSALNVLGGNQSWSQQIELYEARIKDLIELLKADQEHRSVVLLNRTAIIQRLINPLPVGKLQAIKDLRVIGPMTHGPAYGLKEAKDLIDKAYDEATYARVCDSIKILLQTWIMTHRFQCLDNKTEPNRNWDTVLKLLCHLEGHFASLARQDDETNQRAKMMDNAHKTHLWQVWYGTMMCECEYCKEIRAKRRRSI